MNTICKWAIRQGFATGHAYSLDELLNELAWQIAEIRGYKGSIIYRLGPGGSSAILGVYDTFEEWLDTIGTVVPETLDIAIEPRKRKEFVKYCIRMGLECKCINS